MPPQDFLASGTWLLLTAQYPPPSFLKPQLSHPLPFTDLSAFTCSSPAQHCQPQSSHQTPHPWGLTSTWSLYPALPLSTQANEATGVSPSQGPRGHELFHGHSGWGQNMSLEPTSHR